MDIAVIGSNMVGLISYPHPKPCQAKPQDAVDVRRECEGKNTNGLLSPDDLQNVEEDIASCRLIVLQVEIPLKTAYEAIALGCKHNVPVLFNPTPADPNLELARIRGCSYIILNSAELSMLTHMPISTSEEIRRAADRICENDIDNVIVVLEGQGVLWVSSAEARLLPAAPTITLDTTSARDAFIGSFGHHLLSTGSVKRSLELAIASQVPLAEESFEFSSPPLSRSKLLLEKSGRFSVSKSLLRGGDESESGAIRVRIRLIEGHILWQFLTIMYAVGLIPVVWMLFDYSRVFSWVKDLRESERDSALYNWGSSWGPSEYLSNSSQLFALVGGVLALTAIAGSQFGSIADRLGRILTDRWKSGLVALAMTLLCCMVILVNFIWWVVPRSWSDHVLVLGGMCFSVLCVASPWMLIAVVHEPVVEKIKSRFRRKKRELDVLWEEYRKHSEIRDPAVGGDAFGEVAELYPSPDRSKLVVWAHRLIVSIPLLFLVVVYIAGVLRGSEGQVKSPPSLWNLIVAVAVAVILSATLVVFWLYFMRMVYAFFMLSERVVNGGRRRWVDRLFRGLFAVLTLIYGVPLVAGSCIFVWHEVVAVEKSYVWAWVVSMLSAAVSLGISFYFLVYFAGDKRRLFRPVLVYLPRRLRACEVEVMELGGCVALESEMTQGGGEIEFNLSNLLMGWCFCFEVSMLGFRAERLSTLWAKCLKGGLELLFYSVLL
ncbi:PfkB family carbohydrate kinase [Actinomyces sp. oral taxon 169]|uniref:PfkB family carbohydrate kinase n=1 Tax=Actinomyces sp. oral taxon 169 TaxID=712116 RepID=UPI0021B0B4C0|nr:PfkB family carbohydrate kinase [Actinomyces sp. oral taxon 169]